MNHWFMQAFAEALARRDIATLRWEFPYMREGKARPDRPEVAEAAVQRAWAGAAERFPELPRFAGGKSFGGRMTSRAHAAQPLADLRGLVFVGFPLHPANGASLEPTERTVASAADRAEHLPRATGPMLFLQGTRDDLALLPLLRPVVAALGDRATLHVIEGADHGFAVPRRTPDEVVDELGGTAAAWMIELLTRDEARR